MQNSCIEENPSTTTRVKAHIWRTQKRDKSEQSRKRAFKKGHKAKKERKKGT
jgi:hypothetical protein